MSVFLKKTLVTLWRSQKEAMSLVMKLCFLGGGRASLPPSFILFAGPGARVQMETTSPLPRPHSTKAYPLFSHLLFRALTCLHPHVPAPSVCPLLIPQTVSSLSQLRPGGMHMGCIVCSQKDTHLQEAVQASKYILGYLGWEFQIPSTQSVVYNRVWAPDRHIPFTLWTPCSCPIAGPDRAP